jgi:hypothetical protein
MIIGANPPAMPLQFTASATAWMLILAIASGFIAAKL